MKTFKQFFLDFLNKEEDNSDESLEYRKSLRKFEEKLLKEYQKGGIKE